MLLMPKKSEKHTPVVISERHASADNWLRFKVMCDLTLIHNSTGDRHQGEQGQVKSRDVTDCWIDFGNWQWSFKLKGVPAFLQADTGTHLQRQTFEPKGFGTAFQPHLLLSPGHPDMLTLSARDFFCSQVCVCVVRIPGFLKYSGQLCWA